MTDETSPADEEIDDPWAGDPDQDDMADAVAELQKLGG